jgi:hypothetical protein
MGGLVNVCSERGGREVGQKRELGSKKGNCCWSVQKKKRKK